MEFAMLKYEEFPTLLTIPHWQDWPSEQVLPGMPEGYRIEQIHQDWGVVWGPSNDRVYSGCGPVSARRSPAPF